MTTYDLVLTLTADKLPRSLKNYIKRVGLCKPDRRTALHAARCLLAHPEADYISYITIDCVRKERVCRVEA